MISLNTHYIFETLPKMFFRTRIFRASLESTTQQSKHITSLRFKSSSHNRAALQIKQDGFEKLTEFLKSVRKENSFGDPPSHVQKIFASATVISNPNMKNGLQLPYKAREILKSKHPIRHTLEREMWNNEKQGISSHDWLMLFGLSIRNTEDRQYEDMLRLASNASSSGIFSSEIHQTIVDRPENATKDISFEFTQGNKLATLIGDYFAIRAIHFIAKTKNSMAFNEMSKGLENVCHSGFGETNLLEPTISYPFVPRTNASINDWINFTLQSSGYFTGGLKAIIRLNHNRESMQKEMSELVSLIALLHRGYIDIEYVERFHDGLTSPQTLLTLPGIFHQRRDTRAFDEFRKHKFYLKNSTSEITMGESLRDARIFLTHLAERTVDCAETVIADEYYKGVFKELVNLVVTI